MPINRNALMRMRTIDSCLRRRNRLWTIEDLQEACEDALYEYEGISEISTRTIRRDLQLMRSDKLGYNAPIVVRDKKYYTYEDPDYSITQLPLSDSDFAELSSALDIIRHYGTFKGMAGQEDIITRLQDRVNNRNTQQVVYIETNTQLKGLNFLGDLYEYIINKRAIQIDYQSFRAKEPITFFISPYILKEFNNRWFLLGYEAERKSIFTMALDRIVALRNDITHKYIENTFFDPEQYLGSMVGVSRNLQDDEIEVRIWIDNETTPYILTKPLHQSQKLEQLTPGVGSIVSLNLVHNLELERLLLGFGMHLQVLSPDFLRMRMHQHLQAAVKNYEESLYCDTPCHTTDIILQQTKDKSMIQLEGKYTNDCKIFIDNIEETALQLVQDIVNNPAFKDAKIRIMPDTHAGKGIVIGFTAPLTDYVNPNHVGVDIGCTIDSWFTNVDASQIDPVRFEQDIRELVKFGMEYHDEPIANPDEFCAMANELMQKWYQCWPEMIQPVHIDKQFITNFCSRVKQSGRVFWHSLGTVGGGNHFIEVGAEPESGKLVYTIHCGSRNLGTKIARFHESLSTDPTKSLTFKAELKNLITKLKQSDRQRKIQYEIKAMTKRYKLENPQGYLQGAMMSDYLTDMAIGLAYALYNHELISRRVLTALQRQIPNASVTDMVRSIHNYIDFTDHVIRKGAIRAYEGERCVIPFNMRDGLAICRGKSNADWNCSAPHGAGRVMSRAAAMKNLSVEEFEKQMQGIVSTSVGVGTIDEAPDAYKPAELIMELIEPTVDILYLIRPIINLKDKNTVDIG